MATASEMISQLQAGANEIDEVKKTLLHVVERLYAIRGRVTATLAGVQDPRLPATLTQAVRLLQETGQTLTRATNETTETITRLHQVG
jgi:hypothetical protein